MSEDFRLNASDILENRIWISGGVFPGIYYLINAEEIVYVGKSLNVYARIGAHLAEGSKVFDSFSYQLVPAEKLDEVEIQEILWHKPRYNAHFPKNPRYKRLKELQEMFGVNSWSVKRLIKSKNIKPVIVCGLTLYDIHDFVEKE